MQLKSHCTRISLVHIIDANQLLLDQNKRQIEGLLEKFKQISFKRLGDTSRYHLMDEIKNEMQMLNTTNEKLKDNVDELSKLKDTLQEAHLAKELMSYELEKAKSSYDAILSESNSKTKQVEELKNSLENIKQKFDEKCILSAQLESLLNEKDEQLIVLKETNGNLKLEIDELKSHFNLKNEYTFYAVLVKHILKLLNNRDLVYLDNDLLRGEPYQDVIAKRLHQATNKILSFINQYLNLDHIRQM
jgi:chromosome segregation ATPase